MSDAAGAPLLEVVRLSKRFGSAQALSGVSLSVAAGEVVALAGDNGAGKTTLVKIIAGAYAPDAGEVRYRGETVHFETPQQARDAGIETVYQDLALAGNLDAIGNVFLGREPVRRILGIPVIDRRRMLAEVRRLLAALHIDIPGIDRPVRHLSGGQRQAVAIGRAIHWQARLLLMDEPVAALGASGQAKVLDLIRRLKADGAGILIVAHDLASIFAVADRIVVLRNGTVAGERATAATTPAEIVRLMVGG